MLYIDLYGTTGYGNVLFIVANALSLSYRYGSDIKFFNHNNPKTSIFKKIDFCHKINIPKKSINIKELLEFNYNPIYLDSSEDYVIRGYFQSFKYFNDYLDRIKEYIFDHEEFRVKQSRVTNIFENKREKKKTILLHVRRGDYVNLKHIHPLHGEKYYETSLNTFFAERDLSDYKIFLFTDDRSGEIRKWNIIKRYNIEELDFNDPEEIFITMTLFDHYIIANSSLSLISYYFRENKEATITFPPFWYNGNYNYDDMVSNQNLLIDIKKKLENTYIINLDYRTDRRSEANKHASKISSHPHIFNAVRHKQGAIGCTMSHIEILKNAIKNDYEYVVVMEDDIKIENKDYVLNSIRHIMNTYDWNVIVLAPCNLISSDIGDLYTDKIRECQTTTGYIVNRNYYQKLYDNYKEGLSKLIETEEKHRYAIDIYWKTLQRTDNWYCIKKKYIYQQAGYSDIESHVVDYRRSFAISPVNIDYLGNIPIINLIQLEDIDKIDQYFMNFKKLIVNIGCMKIPDQFITIPISVLENCDYDVVQLQTNVNTDTFNSNIRQDSFFSKNLYKNCQAYMLSNNFFLRIREGQNLLKNLNSKTSVRINKPIFISRNDNIWNEYYNVLNSFSKIYCVYDNIKETSTEVSNLFSYEAAKLFKKKKHTTIGIDHLDIMDVLEDAYMHNYDKILILDANTMIPSDFFSLYYDISRIHNMKGVVAMGFNGNYTISKNICDVRTVSMAEISDIGTNDVYCISFSKKAIRYIVENRRYDINITDFYKSITKEIGMKLMIKNDNRDKSFIDKRKAIKYKMEEESNLINYLKKIKSLHTKLINNETITIMMENDLRDEILTEYVKTLFNATEVENNPNILICRNDIYLENVNINIPDTCLKIIYNTDNNIRDKNYYDLVIDQNTTIDKIDTCLGFLPKRFVKTYSNENDFVYGETDPDTLVSHMLEHDTIDNYSRFINRHFYSFEEKDTSKKVENVRRSLSLTRKTMLRKLPTKAINNVNSADNKSDMSIIRDTYVKEEEHVDTIETIGKFTRELLGRRIGTHNKKISIPIIEEKHDTGKEINKKNVSNKVLINSIMRK